MKPFAPSLAFAAALFATPIMAQEAATTAADPIESFSEVLPDSYDSGLLTAIEASPDHQILWSILDRSALYVPLANEDDLTLFAPTDAAFEALDPEMRDLVLNDPDGPDARAVLLYHILGQQIDRAEILGHLAESPIAAQTSAEVTLVFERVGEDVFVEDLFGRRAMMAQDEILTDNGVIHVVDQVMLPNFEAMIEMNTPSQD